MTITPLTTILMRIPDGRNPGKRWQTDPDDPAWYQFVLDHKDEIIEQANTYTVSRDLFNEVRYDLARFYRKQNLSSQYLWIARIINPRAADMEFSNLEFILVPKGDQIRNLYKQYTTTQNITRR